MRAWSEGMQVAAEDHWTLDPSRAHEKLVALEAVRRNGLALQYAGDGLRADREVVLAAVRQNGSALESASEALRADKEVVLEALKTSELALGFACQRLRAEKDFMLEVVKRDGWALKCASERLRADKDVALEAVRHDGLALRFVSEDLRADREVVLEAVRQHGFALGHACDGLRADHEVAVEAIRQYGLAWTFASPKLREDQDLLLLAARRRRTDSRVFCTSTEYQAAIDRWNGDGAVSSAIAVRGEEAPVLSVSLSRRAAGPGASAEQALSEHRRSSLDKLQCNVSLLSGRGFKIDFHDGRPGPILNDLAEALVEELSKHVEVQRARRVFINFITSEDGDAIPVSAWDWNKPLSRFVQTL